MSGTTTGIPNPDKPGHWLVPPWPNDASVNDVVRHFLRFHPWDNTNTAHLVAYFEGYAAALDTTPLGKPADTLHQHWCVDMRDCVRQCARLYREKLVAETNGNAAASRTAAQADHRVALYEKAS
jgi:hypothetical protein